MNNEINKTNMRKIYFTAVLAAIIMISSCTKETVDGSAGIMLSLSSYTFDYDGNESIEVEISGTGGGEISVVTDEGFILVSEPDGNKITISMLANDEPVYRSGSVTVTCNGETASFYAEQEPLRFVGRFVELPINSEGTITRDGRYVAYVHGRWADKSLTRWIATAHYIDTKTGEVFDLDMPAYPADETAASGITAYNRVRTMSDDLNVIVYEHWSSTYQSMVIGGQETRIPIPEPYYWPHVEYVNSDGTIWVGYCYTKEELPGLGEYSKYHPVKWVNGEAEILEVPETDIFGMDLLNGGMARQCSDDGSVIYGSEWAYMGLLYWKDGVMYPVGPEYAEINGTNFNMPETESQNHRMSPNGRYITCRTSNSGTVRVDTETGDVKIWENGYIGNAVTDDGTVWGFQYGYAASSIIDMDKQTITPIEDYFMDNYGIKLYSYNTVKYVSPDGKVFFGDHRYPTEGWMCPQWFVRVSD